MAGMVRSGIKIAMVKIPIRQKMRNIKNDQGSLKKDSVEQFMIDYF